MDQTTTSQLPNPIGRMTKEEALKALDIWYNSNDPEDQDLFVKHQSLHEGGSDTGMWLIGEEEPTNQYECIFCQLESEAGLRQAP